MRTFITRIAALSTLAVLGFMLLMPLHSAHAAEPLLRKPTGSCPDISRSEVPPAGTGPSFGPFSVPGVAIQTVTSTACGPDGLCVGTNIPCNYSLDDIKATAIGIGNWIFGIIGVVVLVMFIYGGTVWLMSAGNSSAVEHGRAIMTGSLIGLLLIFSAGAIVKFFLKTVGARPDIAASLPIDGNGGPGNTSGADTALEIKQTVCSCKVTGVSGAQVAEHNFTGKPGTAVVNTANCKSYYINTLKSKRDAIDPPPGTNLTVQGEYDVYINNATCGLVTTQ